MLAIVPTSGYRLAAPGGVNLGRILSPRPARVPRASFPAAFFALRPPRLGQVSQTGQEIVGVGYNAAAAAATPAAAGALAASVPALAAAAIPLVGAAFAGLFFGIRAIMNSGCGQTCIVSTEFANKAGDLIRQNALAYFALPAPRSAFAQAAYLQNFDTFWAWLQQQCGNPQLGDAGKRCISDRQAGACTWRVPDSQAGPDVPGGPGPGQCFNWFNAYRDPIAADQTVTDSAAADATNAHGFSFGAGSGSVWLLAGGLLLLGWALS